MMFMSNLRLSHKNFNMIQRFFTKRTLSNLATAEIARIKEIYQKRGHELADINPLKVRNLKNKNIFFETIIREPFESPIKIGYKQANNLSDLRILLDQIYCSGLGFEIFYLPNEEFMWLSQRIEEIMTMELTFEVKERIANVLLKSEAFDLFMQKRFNQVKRYGLEGCESASVAFDFILQTALGVDHLMVVMPHRGRSNLMIDSMNYPVEAIFHKLSGESELPNIIQGSGDVFSHSCLQKKITIANNKNGTITLLPNPSHLEAGNPVGLGATYAFNRYQKPEDVCLSVQFHGDAAFTGQGVVSECLQLSQLPNFSVDGTIHIICNNQIGFTTPASLGRSSRYASDPAKAIYIPIIHANADKPEEVVKAVCLAVEYRKKFKKDVVVDIIGWRKMGHNELDEPLFTQPQMYKKIRERPSTAQSYAKTILPTEKIKKLNQECFDKFEFASNRVKEYKPELIPLQKGWPITQNPNEQISQVDTGVSKNLLLSAALQSVSTPNNFDLHPRLQKYHVENRKDQLETGKIDWATAESMAFGSLISEGFNVRLSGQDVCRGTFSHRHLKFFDQTTGLEWEPFGKGWKEAHGNSKLELAPSSLSEFAVLGFEYGMSISTQNVLPIWEAQFGDFFNGAQIVFDTFISNGEVKWGLTSNLTIILPHGFDGAGPEHSSSRMERFLQACDESDKGNWIVTYPTTPANYFHLLRRQMKRNYRKPLIIIGPKTLLRSPQAISPISDFLPGGHFQPVLIDYFNTNCESKNIKIIFMTGKFYYEVKKEFMEESAPQSVIFIRLEELNPFPFKEIITIFEQNAHIKNAKEIIWCQEEPKNMGAYSFVTPKLTELLKKPVKFVGRKASAAPATGISKLHKNELHKIIQEITGKSKSNL